MRSRRVATLLALCPVLASSLSYYEEALPTTLNPVYAKTMVDERTHSLIFDRLFYRSAIA